MRCKFLIFVTIFSISIAGCSLAGRLVYLPDINQGNYLSSSDTEKIKKGMTQQQVIDILGTPMLQNPFSQKIWYYICRGKVGHEKIKQKTLILTFDDNGILIDIKDHNN
ncbi:MAG: outer membrane protein assembly factor BamE [Candidatus Arsenophonus melophagi]|nr:outer membrane protein assembly factor BamE [Candidatus Arsenophonus melophagi]